PAASTIAYALSMQTNSTSRATPFKVFATGEANLQVDSSHSGGATWTDMTGNLPFGAANTQATGLAVSPSNPRVVYLSLAGFTAATGIGHNYKTIDGGAAWSNADGNPSVVVPPPANALPDVPVLPVLV